MLPTDSRTDAMTEPCGGCTKLSLTRSLRMFAQPAVLRPAAVAPATLLISGGILWITALLFKRVRMQSDPLADTSPKKPPDRGNVDRQEKHRRENIPLPLTLRWLAYKIIIFGPSVFVRIYFPPHHWEYVWCYVTPYWLPVLIKILIKVFYGLCFTCDNSRGRRVPAS